jgi:F0F1-type ATP synthase assembly protein I
MSNRNKLNTNNLSAPWPSALSGALTISSWLVGPLIIALLIGVYFDHKYLTGKKYLYIFLALAFIITIIGLINQVIKFANWSRTINEKK